MEEKNKKSYFMLISSMLIFGTIGIFRRYIPLSSGMLAFARGLLGALFLVAFTKLKGRNIRHGIGIKKLLLIAFTGGIMGINWILLFEAYNYTTVATATLCYYMQPAIVILMSPIIFREKLTAKKLICAAVAIVGMIFVSGIMDGGDMQVSDIKGIIFGLGAALFYAAVVILNKKVQIEDAYQKTIIQLFSAAVILIPYILGTESLGCISMDAVSIIMILIVGILHTGIAYALYFGSMAGLKAQSIAVLSYIDPVFALVLSAVILHENMTVYGIVGAVLVIGSAVMSEFHLKVEE